MINVRIRKQNIGQESNPIGVEIRAYVDGNIVGHSRDMGSNALAGIALYYAIPGSRYGYRHDGLAHTTTKCPKGKTGPSVFCGSGTMGYRALPNLPS